MNIDHQKKVLLTGGRAPVTLELARLFAHAGHEVYVADSFSSQLTKASNGVKEAFTVHSPVHHFTSFIADLLKIVQERQIDLILPTCEEVFYVAKGKSVLEKYCNVFCPDLTYLLKLHQKYEFIKLVEEKGLLAPRSVFITSKEELPSAWEKIGEEAVLKPVFSRFGSHITSFDKTSIPKLNFPNGEYVVQKKISGQPICSYSVLLEGEIVAHTQYKVEFSAGNSAAIHFRHIEHSKIENWIRTFFDGEKVTGQFAFDFIETENGEIFPLECNPRATSGVHLFSGLPLPSSFLGEKKELLKPSLQTNRMIALAMLIYGWRNKGLRKWLKAMHQSKDVIWSWRDKKPFFYQFYSYIAILKLSRTIRKSPLEATTFDIEWNGDDK